MKSASKRRPRIETRRARPLLGTFVEAVLWDLPSRLANRAIDAAFAAVQRVQKLMSFHEPASDVSRLNRLPPSRATRVDPWTFQVLEAAQQISIATDGAFDITVAPLLQRWNFLPRQSGQRRVPLAGQMAEIELLTGARVRFRRSLRIDLGGIAKGFAVDQAVAALQAHGAAAGLVNAGGDLRVFGPTAQPIHLRHPGDPGRYLLLGQFANSALATSAAYFSRKKWRGRWISALVDARRLRPCATRANVTVQAPECMTADALTKAVLAQKFVAGPALREFSATAFIVTCRGETLSVKKL